MDTAVKRPKISIYIFILAFLLIIAIAAGIYFLFLGGGKKEPSRGTYVLGGQQEVIRLEQEYKQA